MKVCARFRIQDQVKSQHILRIKFLIFLNIAHNNFISFFDYLIE
jgi:hypothetical protein